MLKFRTGEQINLGSTTNINIEVRNNYSNQGPILIISQSGTESTGGGEEAESGGEEGGRRGGEEDEGEWGEKKGGWRGRGR